MKTNGLNKYLDIKKELNTTNKILNKLESKSTKVIDFVKDYKTGYPHNVKIEGCDVITYYKIKMYKNKKTKLENEIEIALQEVDTIINNVENPLARDILNYRYIADMRFEEIAVKTNNTYENVRNIYYRTLKNLTQNDTKTMI